MTEPTSPPSADDLPGSAESSASQETQDIHLVPRDEEKTDTSPPSSAIFVPLASGGGHPLAAETPSQETPAPVDVVESPTNPFDAAHLHHEESPQEQVGDAPASDASISGGGLSGLALHESSTPAHATENETRPQSVVAVATPGSPPKSQLNMLVMTWASLATLTALYLWWTRPEYPSNLETIPDDGALQSMKASRANVSPLSALGAKLTVDLKETRRFGYLELTPLAIEHRRVKVMTTDGQVAYEPIVLALRLRVKNVGDVPFAPADPVFTSLKDRSRQARTKRPVRVQGKIVFEDGYTHSFAHPVGDVSSIDKRILPLPIEYLRKESVAEQDFPTLPPGETKEIVMLSQEDALQRVNGPMIWRVKLRKGRTKEGTGAATVIGVRFTKNDILMTAPPPENRLEG